MSNKEKIEHLFTEFINGTISEDDKKRFAEILNTDSGKPELDACLYKEWNETEELNNTINTKKSFDKLKEELNISTKELNTDNSIKRETTLVRLLKYAAIIIIAFSIGLFAKDYIRLNTTETISYNEFVVPNGSKSEMILPDGTKIWINSGSSVKYPTSFSATNREVYLEGEAYFDVKRDPNNPFLVKTSDLMIRVLGTSFNIKSYPDEGAIETTLVTGSLEILKNENIEANNVSLRLKPNQKANFSKKTGKVVLFKQEEPLENNNALLSNKSDTKEQIKLAPIPSKFVEQYTAWKDEKLVLIDNTFDETIIKLERWYGVQIKLEGGYIGSGTFKGTFEKETLEQALNAIRLATPNRFNYTIDRNVVKISN